MKIEIQKGIIAVTTADGKTIEFLLHNLNELSNALMIVRQLKEQDQLHSATILYGKYSNKGGNNDNFKKKMGK